MSSFDEICLSARFTVERFLSSFTKIEISSVFDWSFLFSFFFLEILQKCEFNCQLYYIDGAVVLQAFCCMQSVEAIWITFHEYSTHLNKYLISFGSFLVKKNSSSNDSVMVMSQFRWAFKCENWQNSTTQFKQYELESTKEKKNQREIMPKRNHEYKVNHSWLDAMTMKHCF